MDLEAGYSFGSCVKCRQFGTRWPGAGHYSAHIRKQVDTVLRAACAREPPAQVPAPARSPAQTACQGRARPRDPPCPRMGVPEAHPARLVTSPAPGQWQALPCPLNYHRIPGRQGWGKTASGRTSQEPRATLLSAGGPEESPHHRPSVRKLPREITLATVMPDGLSGL